MKSLEQRVAKAIRTANLFGPGDRVAVAVSGGADSVALLRLFDNLRELLAITLLVVHFEHGLRGAESAADARFVEELATAHGLPFVLDRADVALAATDQKWNLEDAARRLRYAFFGRVVAEGRATHVAVAHTADDQAETVLAHLLRGTGPTGLAGIYPVAGPVVRPLLGERREVLRRYLRDLGQPWREDSTNQDVGRLRARIRHRLLPLLESEFSTHAPAHLARLARLAREEERFWAGLVEDRFQALVRVESGKLTIRTRDLLAPLPLSSDLARDAAKPNVETNVPQQALTSRLVRRLYAGLRGERSGLSATHVDQVIHLAAVLKGSKRLQLPNGVVVERTFDHMMFSRPAERASGLPATALRTSAYEYVVNLPHRGAATVTVPELGKRFRLKVIDWPRLASDTKRSAAALDAELLGAPLILRNWRPGDAYRPLGRRHARKLKELFLARHVPSHERRGWPVLESGGRVAWVRGMAPADEFCAREGTKAGVLVEEDRL